MVLAFGRETYYDHSRPRGSRLAECFGIGNTGLPSLPTLGYWCRTVLVYVFNFPLLMTGLAILVTFTWPIGMCPMMKRVKRSEVFQLISVGITTTIDAFLHSPPYLFNTIEASSMRFAGVIGALCGECQPACSRSFSLLTHARMDLRSLLQRLDLPSSPRRMAD